MTFEDALDLLESNRLGFAPKNALRLAAAMRKAAKVSRTSLDQLDANPDAFRARWGRGRVTDYPIEHFASANAFRDWRSSVRSVLDAATGASAQRAALDARQDGWAALLDAVAGSDLHHGQKRAIGLRTIARLARQDALEPAAIDHAWAVAVRRDRLEAAQRAPFARAIRLLDDLRGLPDFAPFLPRRPIGPLPPLRVAGPGRLDRLPEPVRQEWDALFAHAYAGGATPISASPTGAAAEATVQHAEAARKWYVDTLARHGLCELSGMCGVAELADAKLLRAAVLAGEREAEAPGRPAATTIGSYLSSLLRQFEDLAPNLPDELKRLRRKRSLRRRKGPTRERREWCETFVSDPSRVRLLFCMPWQFQTDAKALLDKGAALSARERERLQQLGIVAASLALQLHCSPLRVGNLVGLRVAGPDAELLPPTASQPARLSIPAERVKNGQAIKDPFEQRKTRDPWRLVAWYLDEIRPGLLARLAPDARSRAARFLFPAATREGHLAATTYRKYFQILTAEAGLPMKPHYMRHATASLMINHDPGATPLAAARLHDKPTTVATYYAFFDEERLVARGAQLKSEAVRALARGEKKARRHA